MFTRNELGTLKEAVRHYIYYIETFEKALYDEVTRGHFKTKVDYDMKQYELEESQNYIAELKQLGKKLDTMSR